MIHLILATHFIYITANLQKKKTTHNFYKTSYCMTMFDFKNKLGGFTFCVFIVKLGHQLDIVTTLCIIGDNLFVENNIEAKKKGHMKAMKDDMGNVYVQVFVYRSNLKHILNEYIDNCIESCIIVHVLTKLVIPTPTLVPFVIMDACFPPLPPSFSSFFPSSFKSIYWCCWW